MKYKCKIGAILLSICLILPIFGITTQAASGRISISKASGKVGSQVTISCTVTCTSGSIGTADVYVGYDQTKLQWVSGTNMATGGSGSVHYVGYATNATTKERLNTLTTTTAIANVTFAKKQGKPTMHIHVGI